jgi:hypothetical protein
MATKNELQFLFEMRFEILKMKFKIHKVTNALPEMKALYAAYKDFLRDGNADKAIEKGLI